MHLYSAFCVLLYTQSALQSCGGVSPQPPPVCSIHLDDATAATGQRRQCAHHTPATGGEERERKNQSSVCAHHTPATGGEERERKNQSSVCAHHTPATGGEERESLSQSSGWRLLGGHDWQGPVLGIWPGHRGYTLLFTRSAMGFLMTTESQDLGLTSHPKDGACWQYSVPVTILGC